MSGEDPHEATPPAGPDRPAVHRAAVRRRRHDTPVLPDVTSDERDVGWGESPEPDGDERLLREVPPHHGS